MSRKRVDGSPRRAAGGSGLRDSRGRWVRRAPAVKPDGTSDFVFDDRITAGLPQQSREEQPLHLDEAAFAPAGEPGGPAGPTVDAAAEADLAAPWLWRQVSPRVMTFGALLILGTCLLAVLRLESADFEPLARWFSDRWQATASTAGAAAVSDAVSLPAVKAVAVPSVPGPLARRRAATAASSPRRPAAPGQTRGPVPAPVPASSPAAVAIAAPDPAPVVAAAPDSAPVSVVAAVPGPAPDSPGGEVGPAASGTPVESTAEEEGWFALAEEYRQAGDLERASEVYSRLFKAGSQRGRAALALGDIAAGKGDYQGALERYRESRQLFGEASRRPQPQ